MLTQSIEHQEDSMAGKWEASDAVEHSKDRHGQVNWLHPKTLAKLSNIHERKIRESLEINNLETKSEYDESIKVLNIDRGNKLTRIHGSPCFVRLIWYAMLML